MIARDKTALVGVDVSAARTHGLIYAFRIRPQQAVMELGWEELGSALTDTESIVWLHFDATNMYAREWLSSCPYLPKDIGAFLLDVDDKQYIELLDNTITGVISDIQHLTPTNSLPCVFIWIRIASSPPDINRWRRPIACVMLSGEG